MARRSVSGPDFGSLYRSLRVDHLEPGELDYELLLRNVLIADDESRCKRRRRLKQILKEEREGHEFIVHYDLDPEMDLEACKNISAQLERVLRSNPVDRVRFCKSRLLHLGHRLAVIKNHAVGDVKTHSNAEFNRVLELFSEYFWTEDRFFTTGGESSSDSEELLDEAAGGNPPRISGSRPTGAIPKQPDVSNFVTKDDFRAAMTDIGSLIQALSNQLTGLREEVRKPPTPAPRTSLNRTNPFLAEEALQTQGVGQTSSANCIPPVAITAASHTAISNPMPASSISLIDFNVISSSTAPRATANYNDPFSLPVSGSSPTNVGGTAPVVLPTTTNLGSIPYPRQIPNPANENESFCRKIDAFTFSPFWMGGNGTNQGDDQTTQPSQVPAPYIPLATVAQPSQPVRQPVAQPTRPQVPPPVNSSVLPPAVPPRKMMPVSQWKMKKYAGTDHGLELNEFLSHVRQLAISERASDADLFDSAIHLLEGPALGWYSTRRNQGSLQDWSHFTEELRKEFRHPDLDSVLRTKIYQTRQQKGESFQQYYLQMSKLFQAMSTPMSDLEKVEVLKTNLRYDGRKALVGRRVSTLQDLIGIGKDLDATDFSAFSKVFGTAKRENCAINASNGNVTATRTFTNRNRQNDVAGNQTPNKSSKPSFNNPKGDSKHPPNKNFSGKGTTNEVRPTEQKRAVGKPSFLAKLVSEYRPPSEFECFNCGDDHELAKCPVPRRVFCRRCALKGFTSDNCPYCIKNFEGKP